MGNALFESQGFRWLFDATAEALLLVDDKGQIVHSNPAAQQLFGYSTSELNGLFVESLIPLRYRSKHHQLRENFGLQPHRRAAGAGLELMALTRDGREFPVEISLSPLEADGNSFTLAAIHDITERKNMERDVLGRRREMESMQKLHVAAQTAAVIAHELNQPLLAIASYSKSALLMLETAHPDPDKLRQAMQGSERQAQRAGQSIREMLNFLNMSEFPSEAFDLNQEILDVLGAARSEHKTLVNTILQLEEGVPKVKANRIHIQKALLNLLHNSIEAMQEAGVVLPTLTLKTCGIKNKHFVQATIQDNGPGFRAENFKRIFDPFFTTKAGGIGMGLAISRSLVESNGGHLWAEQPEGPGATFHLTLPFAA